MNDPSPYPFIKLCDFASMSDQIDTRDAVKITNTKLSQMFQKGYTAMSHGQVCDSVSIEEYKHATHIAHVFLEPIEATEPECDHSFTTTLFSVESQDCKAVVTFQAEDCPKCLKKES